MEVQQLRGKDFVLETRLHEMDPELHKRFSESIFVLQKLLSDYKVLFPEFTDHTETHSIAIIDYCNNLLSEETIMNMTSDELYILLMSSYVHDIGMGLSEKDYHEFSSQIDFRDFFIKNEDPSTADVIRAFHNDFSACFVHKYAQLFDFPSDNHEFAVAQAARGHRKADLFDEKAYPDKLIMDNGNTVSLPFLAAILRLADEVNVAKDRNLKLDFDPNNYSTEKQHIENEKHEAIKKMTIFPDRITLEYETEDPRIFEEIQNLTRKLQRTLDYCRKVVEERSDYEITQKNILLIPYMPHGS